MQRLTDTLVDPLLIIVTLTVIVMIKLIMRDAALERNTTGLLALLTVFVILVLLAASPASVHRLLVNLESRIAEAPACADDYTSMVVLGGGLDVGIVANEQIQLMSKATFARAVEARRLVSVQPGLDYPLVLAGGGSSSVSEAQVMGQFLSLAQVPDERMHFEVNSRNTFENAQNVAAIFEQNQWSKDIRLISSALHMPRAVGVFNKLGFEVCALPTNFLGLKDVPRYALLPQTPVLMKAEKLLHEWAGIFYYRLRGWM